MNPKRIQMRRTKGWRKPEGAVYVGRPSAWGNPFRFWKDSAGWQFEFGTARQSNYADDEATARQLVVSYFRKHLAIRADPPPGWADLIHYPSDDTIRTELRGRDLACWCPLDQPCHADVLLELANA